MASNAVTYASRRRVAAEAVAFASLHILEMLDAIRVKQVCRQERQDAQCFADKKNSLNLLVFLIMPVREMPQNLTCLHLPIITWSRTCAAKVPMTMLHHGGGNVAKHLRVSAKQVQILFHFNGIERNFGIADKNASLSKWRFATSVDHKIHATSKPGFKLH